MENTDLQQSSGSGSFKNIKQVDKYTYTMELDTLKYDDEIGKVVANDNGYKTTFTELYGIAGGTTFTVYLPGAPTADMPDGMKNWLGFHYYNVPIPDAILFYFFTHKVKAADGSCLIIGIVLICCHI